MTTTATFVIGIIASGILTIVGILSVAIRRGPSAGPTPTEETGQRK